MDARQDYIERANHRIRQFNTFVLLQGEEYRVWQAELDANNARLQDGPTCD